MQAPLHPNESARLDALKQYHVLDTAPEAAFDELTQLAAQICQTPMAAITFVDSKRLWHKSNFGTEIVEVTRDISFCTHTVASGDLMVVTDPLQDERFRDNPFVTAEGGIRFYAGMPLVTPEGYNVGALCVVDTVPREITPEQLQALRVLGHQAMAQLELRPDNSGEAEDLAAPQSRKQRLAQRRHERLQAAETLQNSDTRYRELFEAMQEGVLIVDAESGTIEEGSPFINEITGVAAPLLKQRVWQIAALKPLFPTESKWALLRQTLAETGDVRTPEIALTALDGRQTWVEFRAHLYQSAGRELVRVHLCDITKSKLDREALRTQQQHNAMLLRLSLNAIVMMDAQGAIVEWNPAAETMFGRTREDVIGQELAEIMVPPELRHTHRTLLARHLRAGESRIEGQRIEVSAMRADGSEFPVELSIGRHDDEGGPIFVASLRDITDRRNAHRAMQRANDELEQHVIERTAELSESNARLQLKIADHQRAEERLAATAQRLRGVLESISDAFVALDSQWRFTYINDQALRLMDKTRDELLGRDVAQGFPDVREIIFEENWQQIIGQGQPITLETYYAPWKIWLEIHAYPSEEGVSIYFQDISARRADQFALEEAKREAEAANAAKSEFIGRISHELRTPLNAILGFGQLLDKEPLSARQQESVTYILNSGAHLLELINEVLDIARVESGQCEMNLEPVAIGGAIAGACALMRPLAEARSIKLRLRAPDKIGERYVNADSQRLAQILINLLSNAIKYNFEQGEVEVAWRVQNADGAERIVVSVCDSGPGISSESLPRLFVPFERGDATNSTIEGTGLGLALTLNLVEAMNGKMHVESEFGRGSTFSFDLPCALASEIASEIASDPAPTPQLIYAEQPIEAPREVEAIPCAYRVLCIEDNASNLRLIELLMATRPEVSLLSAATGQAGLSLAMQHEPDMILLDLNLPDIHGSQVLRQLQQTAVTRDIPVIILSADAAAAQIEALLDQGASDYLTKPLDMRRLLHVLDRILQPASLQTIC